jgi:tRNA-2-methylthio-N6-dimethylallyladenosine synthase
VNPPPTYFVETWGCQMNVLDSQRMAGLLEAGGHSRAAEPRAADVLILNTCNVREKAESKVYSELGRLRDWKRERPGRVIGVAGCVAQHAGDRILDDLPFVDFVVGTGNVERVAEAVAAAVEGARLELRELPTDSPVYQFRSIARSSASQAYVTVIEGCDQFCTFCVVPFTRGRERSRRAPELEAEARALVEGGTTEITLLGQTVNAYRCPDSGAGLAELLDRLCAIEGLRRLRFLTSHPALVSPGLIDAIARNPKVGRYLHLPAQSGSDRILRRMKRRYDARGYLEIVKAVRDRVPDAALSSDFIVGFPGETEEDFRATLTLVERVRFASLFGFLYSPRPGTAAARWGHSAEVPLEVAKKRLERLFELQRTIQKELNLGYVGTTMTVHVEEEGSGGESMSGRTSCNRIVHFPKPGSAVVRPGAYVNVRILRAMEHSLLGGVVGG